jgi:hypothetical protein
MRVITAAIGIATLAWSGNTAPAAQLGTSDLTGAWLVNTSRPKPRLHMPPTVSRAS